MPICWAKIRASSKNIHSKRLRMPRACNKLSFVSRTTPNSRIIFTDAEANIQWHVLPSFFDSAVYQFAATREGGLNIKEPIDYEMEYAALLTACAPLEDDGAKAHLSQECIKYDQRTACLNKIRSLKDLMENLQTEERHVIEMSSEKGASNLLRSLPLNRYGFTFTKCPNLEMGFALDITSRPKLRPLFLHVGKRSPYYMLSNVRMAGIHT